MGWGGTKTYYASQDVLIVQRARAHLQGKLWGWNFLILEKRGVELRMGKKHKGSRLTRTVRTPQQRSFLGCVFLPLFDS